MCDLLRPGQAEGWWECRMRVAKKWVTCYWLKKFSVKCYRDPPPPSPPSRMSKAFVSHESLAAGRLAIVQSTAGDTVHKTVTGRRGCYDIETSRLVSSHLLSTCLPTCLCLCELSLWRKMKDPPESWSTWGPIFWPIFKPCTGDY